MARLQSDPELLAMMQRPDMMAKLQQMMSNPAAAQQVRLTGTATLQAYSHHDIARSSLSHVRCCLLAAAPQDPELQAVMQRLMGGGAGAGGAPGLGGFGGGAGGNPWSSSMSAAGGGGGAGSAAGGSGAAAYTKIHSASQYQAAVKAAGSKLVVVDVSAEWCRPCKVIYPVFAALASEYAGRVVFLKVDGDECRELAAQLQVSGYPTFLFVVQGNTVDRFSGADERRLRATVSQYGDREDVKACPYRHFPLKDTEQVKYADMKWEAVEAKLEEYNAKVPEPQRLTAVEQAELDVVIQKLQNKAGYHSSSFSDDQFRLMWKLLSWPADCIGPVLNLLRVFVLHPHAAQLLSKQIVEEKQQTEGESTVRTSTELSRCCVSLQLKLSPFLSALLRWADVVSSLNRLIVSSDKPVTSMLAVRVLCNFFASAAQEQ